MGIDPISLTAYAAVASAAFGGASALGLVGSKPKAAVLPTPQVPAAPAPTSRNDTGSQVVVGADNVKNQRVTGSNPVRTNGASTADVLGGLGAGGINI